MNNNNNKNNNLVLAYSGGLDTSYCAKYLSEEKGFNVHAVSINTGGFFFRRNQGNRAKSTQNRCKNL